MQRQSSSASSHQNKTGNSLSKSVKVPTTLSRLRIISLPKNKKWSCQKETRQFIAAKGTNLAKLTSLLSQQLKFGCANCRRLQKERV